MAPEALSFLQALPNEICMQNGWDDTFVQAYRKRVSADSQGTPDQFFTCDMT